MNIVKKFFGRKTKSPATKIQPATLSPSDTVALLLESSANSPANINPEEAINKLPYGNDFLRLVQIPNKSSTLALISLARRLDDGELTWQQLSSDLPQLEDQLAVAAQCQSRTAFSDLVKKLSNDEHIAYLSKKTQSSQLRQLLVLEINDLETLRSLAKHFKNKDKNSYKIIKQKIDSFKDQEQRQADLENRKQRLLEELKLHSEREFNSEYVFKFESLERKVHEMLGMHEFEGDENFRSSTEHYLSQCRQTIKSREQQQAALDENEESTEALSPISSASLGTEFVAKVKQLLNLSLNSESLREEIKTDITNLKHHLDTQANRQLSELTKLVEATGALVLAYENEEQMAIALELLTSESDDTNALKASLNLVEKYTRPFTRIGFIKDDFINSALGKALQEKTRLLSVQAEKESEAIKQISILIRKGQAACRDGQLKRAQGIRHSIEEKLAALSSVPTHIARNWGTLQEELEKLVDWQSYAIAPKLDALVDEMKALADAPKSPELQATQIKKLQQRWKSINHGAGNRYQERWELFQGYADTAYEICKSHYDQLDAVREQNTANRATLIQQLLDYNAAYNWDNVDWSQVEQLLRSAKKEWQSFSPSLRAQQKQQQSAFNEAIANIQTKVDEWHEKNKSEKERLINGLATLVNSDDLDHAIGVAIQKQKQWKSIGRCRRKDDEKLWQAFRQHCDSLFARRDEIKQQHRAQTDAKVSEAKTKLDQIRQILDLADDEFEKRSRDIDALRQEYDEIEDLPKREASKLGSELTKLVNKAESRLQSLTSARKQKVWQAAFAAKALGMKQATSEPKSDSEAAELSLAISELPAHLQKVLKTGFDSTISSVEDVEDIYLSLCIRAEIQAGIESPEADKAKRMAIQVEQLQAGFGQTSDSLASLTEQWLSTASIPFANYDNLCERFLRICITE